MIFNSAICACPRESVARKYNPILQPVFSMWWNCHKSKALTLNSNPITFCSDLIAPLECHNLIENQEKRHPDRNSRWWKWLGMFLFSKKYRNVFLFWKKSDRGFYNRSKIDEKSRKKTIFQTKSDRKSGRKTSWSKFLMIKMIGHVSLSKKIPKCVSFLEKYRKTDQIISENIFKIFKIIIFYRLTNQI